MTAMKKRYNVVLAGCQAHIKDRKYEDVSLQDVLYILNNNCNREYLLANNFPMPSIDRLGIHQELNSDYNIYITDN